MTQKKVIFISGPTGCGKSMNAEKLAVFFECTTVLDEAHASTVARMFKSSEGNLLVLGLPEMQGTLSMLPAGTEVELRDYAEACRMAGITDDGKAGKITFIIAPVGCAFHHIAEICNSIGATFFTEIARSCKAEDLPRLIQPRERHQAVFINSNREALGLLYPDAQIIAYYDACRAAGVSPFHTGTGQLIAPLNHAASLAGQNRTLKKEEGQAVWVPLPGKGPMKNHHVVEACGPLGISLKVLDEVIQERAHQMGKGFDASHDDRYNYDDLTRAAIVYALKGNGVETSLGQKMYPWPKSTFKNEGPRANLIKAAALLVAEIERMDRADAIRICNKAVDGYQCSRAAGHEGPCAAFIQSFDND